MDRKLNECVNEHLKVCQRKEARVPLHTHKLHSYTCTQQKAITYKDCGKHYLQITRLMKETKEVKSVWRWRDKLNSQVLTAKALRALCWHSDFHNLSSVRNYRNKGEDKSHFPYNNLLSSYLV